MAMSKAQKNKFVKNRVHLINHIIPSEEFCSYLEAGNHMSAAMKEEIMVCAQSVLMDVKRCYCYTTLHSFNGQCPSRTPWVSLGLPAVSGMANSLGIVPLHAVSRHGQICRGLLCATAYGPRFNCKATVTTVMLQKAVMTLVGLHNGSDKQI